MMYYFQLFLHIALIQCTRGKMSDFMLNLITKGQLIYLNFPKNQRKIRQLSAQETKKYSNQQSKGTLLLYGLI